MNRWSLLAIKEALNFVQCNNNWKFRWMLNSLVCMFDLWYKKDRICWLKYRIITPNWDPKMGMNEIRLWDNEIIFGIHWKLWRISEMKFESTFLKKKRSICFKTYEKYLSTVYSAHCSETKFECLRCLADFGLLFVQSIQ